MRKFFKYLLILFTALYYLAMFVLPFITSDVSAWVAIIGYILLFPVICIPVGIVWSVYNDWDKIGTGSNPLDELL